MKNGRFEGYKRVVCDELEDRGWRWRPNREACAAPGMTGGQLLPNARTREGQRRNLRHTVGPHLGIVQFTVIKIFHLKNTVTRHPVVQCRLLGGDSQYRVAPCQRSP
jgi:hypothetical protein